MKTPMVIESKIVGVVIFDLEDEEIYDDRGSLLEISRTDWIESSKIAMCYMSVTKPGVTRGPHKHEKQADWFYFMPGTKCQLGLVDDRPDSRTRGVVQLIDIPRSGCFSVVIPPGVIHWYKNMSVNSDGNMVVINLPSELYRGKGKKEKVDEVRYEE